MNLQFHGYAVQGFIYSNHNNWNTADTTDGSSAWSEAVLNITAQPASKLRVGMQARYHLLGEYGNNISLDWALADYKFNEHTGIRVGKVKTPMGLLNESRDIDPAQLWALLPESVYPVASRDSTLAHYGAVVYGSVALGERLGRVEYTAYGGARVISSDDGYVRPFHDMGMTLPSGLSGQVYGATVRWNTPVRGLLAGATLDSESLHAPIVAGPYTGTFSTPRFQPLYFFGRFERGKLMLAGEYNRIAVGPQMQFPMAPVQRFARDQRAYYGMASYKLAEKLTAGVYFSSSIDLQLPVSSGRFQKDWAVAGRYDFSPFLYLKLEQHFVDGTQISFSSSDNPGGLRPDMRMTFVRLGVSF